MKLAGTLVAGLTLCLTTACDSSLVKEECGANLCVSHVEVQCNDDTGVAATDVQVELPKDTKGRQMFSLKVTRHDKKGDNTFIDLQSTVTEKGPFLQQLAFTTPVTIEVQTIEGDGKLFKTRFEPTCS